jgi:hypothetical protein
MAHVNFSPAATVETGTHAFTPSPRVPAGQAAPHTPFVQVRVAPEIMEFGHTVPHPPQLFGSDCRLTHAVGLTAGQARVAELVRAAHSPFAKPVAAFEQAWHARPQPLLQHTPSTQKPDRHSVDALHAVPSVSWLRQILLVAQ